MIKAILHLGLKHVQRRLDAQVIKAKQRRVRELMHGYRLRRCQEVIELHREEVGHARTHT